MNRVSDEDDAILENCVDNDVPEGANWWVSRHRDTFYKVGHEMLAAGMPVKRVCLYLRQLYQAVAAEFDSSED